jgi:hypothetical protein
MMWLGDFRTGKTVRFGWHSNAIAGESITRATNGTISVYKDGGTTQSTTGVTDTEDFDSLTGVHLVAIDTSADGTFYSAGSDFMVVLSGATIDGKSINAVLAHFSLEARSALMPTTDGRKLDVSAGGEAGVDWANVGSPSTTVGLSGTTVKTATDVETDTADIQGRLPAALVSGRMSSDAVAISGSTSAADAVESNIGNLDAAVSTRLASSSYTAPPSAEAVADQVWDETMSDHVGAGSTGERVERLDVIASGGSGGLTNARAALLDNLDAAVTSRSSHSAADVWTSGTRTLTAFGFSVTVGTNNDKSGYSLSAAGIQAIWDAATSALTTVGSIGKLLVDNVNATISSRSSHAAADVWAVGTRTLTAFSFAVDISAAAVTSIWDKATSALTAVGSIGKLLVDNVNATISSRASQSSLDTVAGYVDTEVAAIKTKTDNLPAAPAAVGDIPTAAQNAAGLLDLAAGVETNRTVRQALRLMLASAVGKLSGAATSTVTIRDTNDSVNRVVATVDADGNRSSVTLDAS